MPTPNRYAILAFSEMPVAPEKAGNPMHETDVHQATVNKVRDAVLKMHADLAAAGVVHPDAAVWCNEHGHDHIRATEAETDALIAAVKAAAAKPEDVVAAIEKLSSRALMAETDLAKACDAAVHGHEWCVAGRKAHEHIATLLTDNKAHQAARSHAAKTLRVIRDRFPGTLAAAHANIALETVEPTKS